MKRGPQRGPNFAKVVEYKIAHPNVQPLAIADVVNLSPQRVIQILIAAGLPHGKFRAETRACKECGKTTTHISFCSNACRYKWHTVELVCEVCGNTFSRDLKYVTQGIRKNGLQHVCCDKRCFGKWLGLTHGKGAQKKK